MPNNIDSLPSNSFHSQYQSQQSTSANSPCQQQDNLAQLASAKNKQTISDTKPYTSSSSDTPSSDLNIKSRPIKEKPLPCGYPGCDKTFPSNSKLDRHQRIHTGEKPFKCTICPKDFTNKNGLNRHEFSHIKERAHKCADCGKGFILKQHLNQHKRVHTGERPYKCTICPDAFTQIGSLNIHERIHTGEKPYKCTICPEAFTQISILNAHKRVHTGERPYKCTICSKTFTQRGCLNKHRHIHEETKPNKCTICDKVFDRIDKLNRHFKKIHIQNNPIDNQIREIINNCNDNKKNILNSIYNSIVKQCQNKSISIEKTLVNIFHSLTKKYISNDDAQNVTKNLVSIITQLPPQFKSTDCLDIRKKAKITSYTDILFILKNHTVDEFLEKYPKIEIPQSGDNQDLSTKKRTRSDSLNDDETIPGKKVKSAHEIKIEPSSELTLDIDGLQITSTSKIIQAHNNSLPILHAPGDDTKDLMPESENTTLKISMWGDNLKAIFATMPQDEQKQAKQSIIQQCNDWVSLNRDKREEYAKNLDDSLEITIPIIDEVERGTSVFAKKPFKIFDVIGPFSGALYTNQKDLNNRMRKQGTSNVMEFLFNTISKNRFIDGTQGGNTLSYINTGQLLDYPKIAENNLAIIYAGKNFSFYVAIKPIAQGEELFIDYGPNYTGREQIKVEAE